MDLDNILQIFRKPYPDRIHLGLERINEILRLLDEPHNKYPSIHIAGTNGKGSTSSMLHSVFCNLGYKVGLFTSPHLERFTERIKINDQEITEEDFVRILNEKVIPAVDKVDRDLYGEPTEFEVLNAVAYYYFAEQGIDLAVFEVGLGGRLDSTNALKNVVISVITSISFDHMDRLGNTLKEIAGEKAGIIKTGVPVVTTVLNPHHEVFQEKTDILYFSSPEHLKIKELKLEFKNDSKEVFYPKAGYIVEDLDNKSMFYKKEIFLPFIAKYQLENLSLVLKTLEVIYNDREEIMNKISSFSRTEFSEFINISKEDFINLSLEGIKKAKWFGRFEPVNFNGLNIILDGAHNEEGMSEFVNTLSEFKGKYKNIITIFACNKDKDYKKMLDFLYPLTDYFVLTKSHVQIKAKEPEDLSEYLTSLNKDNQIVTDYRQSIEFVSKIITKRNYEYQETLVCICGSLYLIGAMRAYINSIK